MTESGKVVAAELGARLRRLDAAARRFERHLGEALEVNDTDLRAMGHLAVGPTTPSELAARLGVTSGAATQIVDRLERVGHAHRERQAGDRRVVHVVANDASVARARSALAPMSAGMADITSTFTAEELVVVARFLDEVTALYERVAEGEPSSISSRSEQAEAQ